MLRSPRVFAVFALALALPELALAHAILVSSTPKLNGIVAGDHVHADLKFNSRVDGPRCTLALLDPDGKVRPLTLSAQHAPDEVEADITGLHQGSYSLRWQALASDGHITRGSIPFQVKPQ